MNMFFKRMGGWAVLVFGCLILVQAVQAASFDCAKAGNKVEKLICEDAELSKLDEELSVAYKAALKFQERADFIKRYQGKWLNQRNRCATPECVKRLYEKQLLVLPSTSPSSEIISANKKSESDVATNGGVNSKPGFGLIKGKGVKVCDAYEKNLNSFINPINKYSQINPKFGEFSLPDISYLDAPPDSNIYPEMLELVWERDLNPANIISHTYWRGTREEYYKAEDQFFHGHESTAFIPIVMMVDIDNDGKLENVILATFCGNCSLLIYVAQDNMLGLDYEKTRLLVKHPTVAERGILRAYTAGEWKLPGSIASGEVNVVTDSPHAADYGVFTFAGKNYYYMMWNDPLLLQKDGKLSGSEYRETRLHVFLADKKMVKEVCTLQPVFE